MRVLKTYESALAKLREYIETHALRHSPVREMVLEQVCTLSQPFTAEQLEQACLAEHISQGTIYNNLRLFIDAHILHAIERQRGKSATRYALIPGKQIQAQMICGKCGRVSEFKDQAIDHLLRVRKYPNFEMQHYSLFVYGECKHCRRKAQE